MSGVLSKIREGLFKLSEIELEYKETNSVLAMEEFIDNISYLRKAPDDDIINSFRKILFIDKYESIRFLFFIRSIKSGLGERRIFRVILKYLGRDYPELLINNLNIIPKYGRWDDLYSLFDTPLEKDVISLFKYQIQEDLLSKNPSTLGKWLKSENASSKESRVLGLKTRVLLDYTPKEYRKLLSTLRRKLNLIEVNLSSKEYSKIDYEKISKLSLNKYKKALYRNDNENYTIYCSKNIKGSNLCPNKIIHYILNKNKLKNINNNLEKLIFNITIKESKSIEDTFIINGLDENQSDEVFSILIFSILLYKKINLNAFKNYYISYKRNPKFNKLIESSLIKNIELIYNNYINFNIDLEAALDLLLFTILKKNLNDESKPKSVLFIYNSTENINFNISEDLVMKWLKAGLELPRIKLWNLKNMYSNFSIVNINNVINMTGYNNKIWPYLIESKEISNSQIILDKYKKSNFEDIII